MSSEITVSDLKNLELTNFFHYFLKANYTNFFSGERILADFEYVFLTILSNEQCWCGLSTFFSTSKSNFTCLILDILTCGSLQYTFVGAWKMTEMATLLWDT